MNIFQNKDSGRKIVPQYYSCAGIYHFPIYSKEGNLLGNAWVMEELKDAGKLNGRILYTLLDICIYKEKHRRSGAGSEIMDVITKAFPKIYTGKSTVAGSELCKKHGFEEINSEGIEYLFFTKSKEVDNGG